MMVFDYYYGAAVEHFSFFRIPRLLVKDKRFSKLSSDAKLLYGLMLDRMTLSMKNNWFDGDNKAYILYTVKEIMEDLGRCNQKCARILAELDTGSGIGLIERKSQGQGKPDLIYVKDFTSCGVDEPYTRQEPEVASPKDSAKAGACPVQKCENHISRSVQDTSPEVCNSHLKKCVSHISGSVKDTSLEMCGSHPSYINNSYIDYSYTDPIYPSDQGERLIQVLPARISQAQVRTDQTRSDQSEEMRLRNDYEALLKANLDYDIIIQRLGSTEKDCLDGYIDLMLEDICSADQYITVGRQKQPRELVKSKYLKLRADDVLTVIDRINSKKDEEIGYMPGYIRKCLFTVRQTISSEIAHDVSYNIFGEGRNERNPA